MAYGLGIPFHVATHGAFATPLGLATDGVVTRFAQAPEVVAVPTAPFDNVGSSYGPASRDFWVRENAEEPLFGPLTFYEATKHARYLSQVPHKSGTAEIVTYLGERGGDPHIDKSRLMVAYVYVRGRRMLGGRAAEFQSEASQDDDDE